MSRPADVAQNSSAQTSDTSSVHAALLPLSVLALSDSSDAAQASRSPNGTLGAASADTSSSSGRDPLTNLNHSAQASYPAATESELEEVAGGSGTFASRSLCILYGSQTGNAQDVAERVAREATRRRFEVRCQAMDDYDKSLLIDEPLVVFVLSTTGQGDAPSNMLRFWRFLLRRDLPSDILSDLRYAIFGLGDTSYPRYCWPARRLDKRLVQLGAQAVVERGEADDQHYLGIDGALDPWLVSLWSRLSQLYPLPEGVQPIPDSEVLPPRVHLRLPMLDSDSNLCNLRSRPATPELSFAPKTGSSLVNGGPTALPPTPRSSTRGTPGTPMTVDGRPDTEGAHDHLERPTPPEGMRWAVVKENRRITARDWTQDVRHVELQLEGTDHRPGDVASLRPENMPADVERLLETLGHADVADVPLDLQLLDFNRPLPRYFPHRPTLRYLFTRYFDAFSVPRRSFFEWIRYFAKDDVEREKLEEFCSAEGQDELYQYAHRVRRTIAEVLDEFHSVDIPLDYLFDVFPEIRPRQFSISNSPKMYPDLVHLTVAIVKYKTKLKLPRRGVCTTWIAQLKPGDRIPIGIESGTMHLPASAQTPVVLIGPGTGVAPMRAFLQDRFSSGSLAPSNLLFPGCRKSACDFHYAEEWKAYAVEEPRRLRYHLAASRDQEEKVYVQDKIREYADEVWDVVGVRGGSVYISGSSGKMPEGVRAALCDVLQSRGGMSADEAERYLIEMESARRLQEECWS